MVDQSDVTPMEDETSRLGAACFREEEVQRRKGKKMEGIGAEEAGKMAALRKGNAAVVDMADKQNKHNC